MYGSQVVNSYKKQLTQDCMVSRTYGGTFSYLYNSYTSSPGIYGIYKPVGPERPSAARTLLRARGFINTVYPIGRDV